MRRITYTEYEPFSTKNFNIAKCERDELHSDNEILIPTGNELLDFTLKYIMSTYELGECIISKAYADNMDNFTNIYNRYLAINRGGPLILSEMLGDSYYNPKTKEWMKFCNITATNELDFLRSLPDSITTESNIFEVIKTFNTL